MLLRFRDLGIFLSLSLSIYIYIYINHAHMYVHEESWKVPGLTRKDYDLNSWNVHHILHIPPAFQCTWLIISQIPLTLPNEKEKAKKQKNVEVPLFNS